MKKITSLLMMLCMFVGAVNAEVTKYYKPGERLSTLTEGQKVMFYNTCLPDGQDRTGFLIDNAGSFALNKQKPSAAPFFSEKVGVWTLQNVTNTEGVYTVNVKGANGYVGIAGKTNNVDAKVLRFQEWTAADAGKKAGVNSENAAGTKVNNADITAEDKVWLVANENQSTLWNGNQNSFTTWESGHPYAIYSVVEATTAELEAMLATAKTAAVNELNPLKNLSVIYSAETVESAIASVNAVALENDDLETALNAIDALVVQVKLTADGKNVKFCNKSTDGRGGNYLGYDKANSRAAAVADGGDAAIWTIKTNADGTFKLYNWVNNHYLGTPADPTPVVAAEANAPSFKFIVTAENEVAIATGDKMVHIANHNNYKVIHYWSTTDKASLWAVTVVPEIVVTHEQYNAALAAQSTLPYAVQQAYGLVTDASNYYSNYKSDAEGSYAALLDNTESSFFHSAYDDEPGDGSGVHYIQATLAEGVDEFYFYMLPRSGNGNNRPKNITVSGSNDGTEFTKICDVTTTLDASMNPYVSDKLGTKGTTYKYIRLTVNSTNTNTTFFTLSELYFLLANADVENLVNAYKNFASSSITSAEMATAATALINAETVLSLSNIKKEVNALLTANATNHAETPALGQYSTAAYNALQAAYDAADATQESLETAIAAFKKAKNVPVYFITSKHGGYAAGSAIYYDGAWKWKAANKYDKQMWMTIADYYQANVPAVGAYDADGTSYAICDYLTGTKMRGKDVQIVKVADWDGAYNLQYNANANSTDAAQHAKDTGDLVNWKPGTKDDAQASVWGVEYLGSSYELDQLTDEKIAALAGLQTAYNAVAYLKDATIGAGLGQYKGSKDAIEAAVTAAEVIEAKTLAEQAVLEIATIEANKTALNECADDITINLPVTGKYYRFQGACEASLPGYYITGHTNWDGGRIALTAEADASTIYYFDGTNLIAYQSGLVIGLNKDHYVFASVDDNSKPASTITFAGSPLKAGAYSIKSADRYFHYKVYNDAVEIDRCQDDVHAEHAWYITEVTELPVTITAAGYASFYAPVEVTLPEGVTAHTVTENGEWATLSEAIKVVPAKNGVILAGEARTYNLTVSNTSAENLEGALAGTVAKTLVTKTENDAYYVLGVVEEEVGLYNPVIGEDNTKFYNAGHKAYWHIPAGIQTAGFRFGGNTTAIESVLNNGVDANAPIYDLSGRRVNNAVKGGIYIQNGKKFIVK